MPARLLPTARPRVADLLELRLGISGGVDAIQLGLAKMLEPPSIFFVDSRAFMSLSSSIALSRYLTSASYSWLSALSPSDFCATAISRSASSRPHAFSIRVVSFDQGQQLRLIPGMDARYRSLPSSFVGVAPCVSVKREGESRG